MVQGVQFRRGTTAEHSIHGTMKTLYPSFGIVENDLCDQCSEINDLVLLVSGKLPDISDNLLK
jgi:hypothetical protein